MMRTFSRHSGHIRMELEGFEAELLRRMRDGLRASLQDSDPDDPAVQRLFPAAVVGDEEADAELRRLLRDDLLTAKLAGLDALVEILDRGEQRRSRLRVQLREDEPLLVLGVLNDLRLALGARIGLDDLERESIAEDDPIAGTLAVMDHFAWWQEQLIAIIDPVAVHHGEEEPRPDR